MTALEMARRFAVSQVLREKAAKRREAAHGAEAIRSMPNHLQGKQLSSFLREGKLLCGAWQSNRCTRDESACGAAHRCAVMLKSGRVCGGKHQAMVCRDRRALLVTGTPSVSKEEPASPVPSAGAVSEPASAKKKRKKKKKDKQLEESTKRAGSPQVEVSPPPKRQRSQPSQPSRRPAHPDDPPRDTAPPADDPDPGHAASERRYDRLATVNGKTAEPPTLIYQSVRKGQVFLAGLPTSQTLHAFPATDLQVVCFPESPGGISLPRTMVVHMSPTWTAGRTEQWKNLWPLLRGTSSSRIHCGAGEGCTHWQLVGCEFPMDLVQEGRAALQDHW